MDDRRKYPENRLDIRVDENGHISYEENAVFAKYYTPTREELEEELEELQNQHDLLNLDEPADILSIAHDEWEDAVADLEDRIREIEEEIESYGV